MHEGRMSKGREMGGKGEKGRPRTRQHTNGIRKFLRRRNHLQIQRDSNFVLIPNDHRKFRLENICRQNSSEHDDVAAKLTGTGN
jgi:hypothetical protein